MLERFLGDTDAFFEAFEEHAARTLDGARQLRDLLAEGRDVQAAAQRIKAIEDEGDAITHRTIAMLHRTFVAPLDRNQIFRLILRMDDVLDLLEAAAELVWLYEIHEPNPHASRLAELLVASVEALNRAMPMLRELKKTDGLPALCIEIHRLENEADDALRAAIADLFATSQDPLHVLKWKEIYEKIETATDRCEDVAHVLEGISIEP
jgi:hypothetical protein